ncbi:hypothetical protein BJX76DRAFT_229070 [Aspergillus varians]
MISRAICRTENSAIQQKFLAASKSPVCKPAPVCAFLFSSFNIKRLFYSVGFLLNFTAGLLSVVGLAKSPKPSPILSDFLSCDTRIYLVVLHHDVSGLKAISGGFRKLRTLLCRTQVFVGMISEGTSRLRAGIQAS